MKILSSVVLFVLVCCVVHVEMKRTRKNDKELGYATFCDGNGNCAKVSYDELMSMFKNYFKTSEEIKSMKETMKNKKKKNPVALFSDIQLVESTELVGDGDMCCATDFVEFANLTMENIYGESRAIIHLTGLDPPQYQYIPHGYCAAVGDCEGTCLLEEIILTLLIYDFELPGIAFDAFPVPGYCACKNIGSK